ncbi:mersacidin/lichenicidin family type 2 lantibiotic [Polymorphospora sp. NPDC050346]|uniref:mersacidin/lichenicidin family type 2 lantibiotic n=1 Tax=Polymorphospora sp. NPDC050346 TaxID=3155780 RepID=UPI0033DECF20
MMDMTIRAWKDPAFRATLDRADLAAMADSPVGPVGGVGSELGDILGGSDRPFTFYTCFTCNWMGCNGATVDCTWPFC